MHEHDPQNINYQYANPQNYYQQSAVHQSQYYQYPAVPDGYHLRGWVDYKNPAWIKGAVVGAAAAFVIANPVVRKTIVKGVVGLWGSLQGGVEELKEQIRDIQAEKGEDDG